MEGSRPNRLLVAVCLAAALAVVGALALVGVVLPYRQWDAFAYGHWSREIAATGGFHVADGTDLDYQRPLFYVLQGWLWGLLGFHVVLGRLLSLAFTLLLLGSTAALARRTALGAVGAALAVLVCLLLPDVPGLGVAGLTDVPAAAMVALTALLVVRRPRSPTARAGVAVVAALTVVTKPSAVLALAGLLAARLLVGGDPPRRRLREALPLVAGILAGVAYFGYEAHRLGESLPTFLSAGTTGYYTALAAQARADALLRSDLVGPDLRLLAAFAVVYALGRILRAPHRAAVAAAVPLAAVASWVLPALAAGGSFAGPFSGGFHGAGVAYCALLLTLPLAAAAPEPLVPQPRRLALLLVWAAPVVALWSWRAAYSPRLASPAWPPLVLLVVEALALVLAGSGVVARLLPAVPVAALAALALLALPRVDGLGPQLWHAFWRAGPSGWSDGARMRSLALGALDDEVTIVREQIGSRGRAISSDGRLPFFLGSRATTTYPRGCGDLRGYRAFVLLRDPDSVAAMDAKRPGSSEERFWSSCRAPSLTQIRAVPSVFVAYAVGPVSPAACHVPPPAPGLVAVFGRGLDRRAAEALRARAVATGFEQTDVEQVDCNGYEVVLRGFSGMANARDFAAEAKRAGLPVVLERRP